MTDATPVQASGINVLEIAAGSHGASFAGRLLRRLGMQVTKLELAGRPDPLRTVPPLSPADAAAGGLPFQFLNDGKRLVTVDPETADGKASIEQLLAEADVLIQGGLSPDDIVFSAEELRAHPSLVAVSVTPAGVAALDGERIDDFLAFHRSGLGYITPRTMPGFPTAGLRPLKPYSRLLEYISGFQAAISVLATLVDRARGGPGDRIDVASIQCGLPLIRREMAAYLFQGDVSSRGERLWKVAPAGIQQCQDGYVFVDVIEDAQWERLCALMERADLLADERFQSRESRFNNNDALSPILDAWFERRTRSEVTELGQQRGVPIAPVNAPRDLFDDPQLLARGFFQTEGLALPGGSQSASTAPASASRRKEPAASPAPPRAANGAAPLAGFRVLELTHVWAGPLCGQILADLGAEVIRVESQRRIDVHRTGGPYPDNKAGLNRSGVWNSQNRGKLSCTLNLATDEGKALARDLIAQCDAVVENFSPGTLERLGLGFEALMQIRPDLVLVSLSAYGQTGPQRRYVGYGPMMDAACGIMAMTEYGDGVPRAVNGWAADIGGALTGALEVLRGLLFRQTRGAAWADVSEYEASALFQVEGMLAWSGRGEDVRPHGNLGPGGALTECFACQGEDRWVAVSTSTQAELDTLARLVDGPSPKLAVDCSQPPGESYAPLIEAVSRWTGSRDRGAVLESLRAAGVPAGPVSDLADVMADPVLTGRGAFVETEHAEVGRQVSYGPVWQIAERSLRSNTPAPCLGQHNGYVFSTLLGLDAARMAELQERKVIY